jgi:RimJ/RimL family protein N-acetyltransferase
MTVLKRIPADIVETDAPPALRTARLLLRTPEPQDARPIAALLNDRRIAENTSRIPHPYSPDDAERFIAHARSGGEIALLVTLPDGTIIGGAGIGTLRGDVPEIGYWFGVPYWGHGYATEAARALLNHAFADLGHALLHAGARVSNPASRRVLEKCGYEWTHVALLRVRALNTSVPCDRFRLTRERWDSLADWAKVQRVA